PDLDVFWFGLAGSDVVTQVTWHRGPSHSLPVLAVAGWLLWLWLKRRSALVGESPRRWLWAIWLALLTHPLLDAFTVYGTQLLWPLQMPPVMWSSIFIIDPAYTLPLLFGVILAWWLSPGRAGGRGRGRSGCRAAQPVGAPVAGHRPVTQLALSGLEHGGQMHGGPYCRAKPGHHGIAGCSPLFHTAALQYAVVARDRDGARWLLDRRPFADCRSRAHAVHLPAQR